MICREGTAFVCERIVDLPLPAACCWRGGRGRWLHASLSYLTSRHPRLKVLRMRRWGGEELPGYTVGLLIMVRVRVVEADNVVLHTSPCSCMPSAWWRVRCRPLCSVSSRADGSNGTRRFRGDGNCSTIQLSGRSGKETEEATVRRVLWCQRRSIL